MKKIQKTIGIIVVFVVVLFACRKEQMEIGNAEDPCDCASEVSADFDILERHIQLAQSEFIVTDHVLGGGSKQVRFRAIEKDAEYKWFIGLDVEVEKETFKNFGSQWIGSTIPITLVVKKEPNLICFPDDDGYDSITKTFNIYDECHEPYLLEGTFRMAEKKQDRLH